MKGKFGTAMWYLENVALNQNTRRRNAVAHGKRPVSLSYRAGSRAGTTMGKHALTTTTLMVQIAAAEPTHP